MSIELKRVCAKNYSENDIIINFDTEEAFLVYELNTDFDEVMNMPYIIEDENIFEGIKQCFQEFSIFSWQDFPPNVYRYVTTFFKFRNIKNKVFMEERNVEELEEKINENKALIKDLHIAFKEKMENMTEDCILGAKQVTGDIYDEEVRKNFDDWRNGKRYEPKFDPKSITNYAEKCSMIVEEFMGKIYDEISLNKKIKQVIAEKSL